MNYRSFAVPLVFFVAGCSSSTPDAGNREPTAGATPAQNVSAANRFEAAHPSSYELIDVAHPLFIQTQPGARCNFRKPGSALPGENIDAESDGKVHFFAPPKSWATGLDVECKTGSSSQRLTVNLDDPSTYRVDDEIAQREPSTSLRPALTGDLQAIPAPEVLSRGYPPRPDPKLNPERYRRWVDIVSVPRPARKVQLVKALGHQASEYWGTYAYIDEPGAGVQTWGGRAYDAVGWYDTTDNPDISVAPDSNYYAWYLQYDTYMTVPSTTCTTGACFAYEWAGMGGMERSTYDNTGITNSSLIQSGIYLQSGSAPSLFFEYAPDSPALSIYGEFALTPGDDIEVWGWLSSSTDCNDYDTSRTGMVACFGYYNMTSGEYTSYYGYYWNLPPYGSYYYGFTFESMIEKLPNQDLINYDYVNFNDLAYGADGNYHSAFTDPWIFLDSYSENRHLISDCYTYTGTYDDAWDYQVDWENYR